MRITKNGPINGSNMAKKHNKLKAEIVKMLPDDWSIADRLKFLEEMADDYRSKSRAEVYKSDKVKGNIDYTPITKTGKG